MSEKQKSTGIEHCPCGAVATRGISAGGKTVWLCEACFDRRTRELTKQAREGRLP